MDLYYALIQAQTMLKTELSDEKAVELIKILRKLPNKVLTHAQLKAIITPSPYQSISNIDFIKEWQINMLNTHKQTSTDLYKIPTLYKENANKQPTLAVNTKRNSRDITALYGITNLYKVMFLLAPKSQYKSAYLLLDTNNTDPSISTTTMFRWNFLPNYNVKTGTVNAIGNVKNIVAMRILPVKANFDASPSTVYASSIGSSLLTIPTGTDPVTGAPIWNQYYNNFINTNNNFTILIEEFKAQSFVGREGRRFHFVLFPAIMNLTLISRGYITPINPYIEYVTSGKGGGYFYFDQPMTSFSTLSVTMADPFGIITLSKNVRTLIPLQLFYVDD